MSSSSSSVSRDAERTIYSVGEITRHIKHHLESAFTGIWIAGELSNLKRPSSGHRYFTLKDDEAQISAVMFQGDARRVRFRPEDGMAVLVWGHITVYEPRGNYQIRVKRIEPRGKGELQLAFEQLKAKLEKEGLFAESRKRPLPLLPQRVGIVTSPSGDAVRDLCRILHRRYPNLEVLVYPAKVQGSLAAAEISKGVRVLNRMGGFDVLIVTRGGGSLEDLWPFNEESVARAIAASAIPVVSAVGHEADFTIADFVADRRAATPSAAAEIVVERKEGFVERVAVLNGRLNKAVHARHDRLQADVQRVAAHQAFMAVRHAVERRSQQVDEADSRIRRLVEQRLAILGKRLDETTRRLEAQRMDHKLGQARATLTALSGRLDAAELRTREGVHRTLGRLAAKLDALSPLGVLGRGYSLTWTAQGKLLRRAADAAVGDAVRVDLNEGSLHCRVEEKPEGRKAGSKTK